MPPTLGAIPTVLAVEWYRGDWTLRGGLVRRHPACRIATDLDTSFQQFQWLGEIERRYELWGHPGKIALTGFLTRARLGAFSRTRSQLAQATGAPADISAVRKYQSRGGVSMNVEQEITDRSRRFHARWLGRWRGRARRLQRH